MREATPATRTIRARSAIYAGTVMHARRAPRANVFRYPVWMALVDLDELAELDRSLRLFGWNRSALASYHDADHVDVRALLERHGVVLGPESRLQVLTNLRVCGYVFNPVSFWWAWHGDGSLAAVVAEVSNTFRERLPYVLLPSEATRDRAGRGVWETDKLLHVSPFMPMEQRYTWRVGEPGDRLSLRVDVHDEQQPDFHAAFTGHRVPLTSAGLASWLVRAPLMPLRVTARIHWQAAAALAQAHAVPPEAALRRR